MEGLTVSKMTSTLAVIVEIAFPYESCAGGLMK